jgi:hypothetical protein
VKQEIGLLNVALCDIPVILSSEALLQYLVRERDGFPKSLATLLIALMARRIVSGAMFAL